MSTATTDAPRDLDEAREQADAIAPPAATPPADAKPKRTRAPRKRAPRKRTTADRAPRASTPRATSLRAQLEEAITSIGFVVMVFNANDGRLIMEGAKRQAAALDALAKENPAVRAALSRLLTTSVYAGLAMAFAPTLLGIAANHNIVPPLVAQLAGAATTPPPASGEAGEPEASDPLAGVDLTNVDPAEAAALLSMFAASQGAPEGESDGVPRGIVTGAHPVG